MFGQPREDMRVADYVLGLMDAEEARLFEREMQSAPGLAVQVDDWRSRVARFDADEPNTPQAEMRRRIEAGLRRHGGAPIASSAPATRPMSDLPGLLALGTGFFVAGILLGGMLTWLLFGR